MIITKIQLPHLCNVANGIRSGTREVTSHDVQMIQLPQAVNVMECMRPLMITGPGP